MSKLISVIIPTYNRGELILRAINSVLIQSYQNFELIVIDDGSTDKTEDLLAPLVKSEKIKYSRQENRGVSSARNTGVGLAKGELISFLDSDDEWLTDKLQHQISFLEKNSHLRIAYTEEFWIRNGKRVNQKTSHKKSGGWIFSFCVGQCLIGPSSVIMEKKLFTEMNGFDENFIVCEDYDLWLKISSLYEIGFIKTPLITKHGGHNDQLSTKFVAMDFWRIKALSNILDSRSLKSDEINCVKESIRHRATILLQGYLKHQNMENYKIVEEILLGVV
jgi:glycosyltransferase involved in cell wall biosynthesis